MPCNDPNCLECHPPPIESLRCSVVGCTEHPLLRDVHWHYPDAQAAQDDLRIQTHYCRQHSGMERNSAHFCQHCDTMMSEVINSSMVSSRDDVCSVCFVLYRECIRCGRMVQMRNETEAICSSCRASSRNGYLLSGSARLMPRTNHPDGTVWRGPYIGIELELLTGLNEREWSRVNERVNNRTRRGSTVAMLAKHDGSLPAKGGTELIAEPLPVYHRLMRSLGDIESVLSEYAPVSDSRAGTHIHITRQGWRIDARLVYFMSRHAHLLATYGERINSYANWVKAPQLRELRAWNNATQRRGDRYSAINITNAETLELRFFRGVTGQKRLYAYALLAAELVRFTSEAVSYRGMSWRAFLRHLMARGDAAKPVLDHMETLGLTAARVTITSDAWYRAPRLLNRAEINDGESGRCFLDGEREDDETCAACGCYDCQCEYNNDEGEDE